MSARLNPIDWSRVGALIVMSAVLGAFFGPAIVRSDEDQPADARRARRLEAMKRSAAQYRLFSADDPDRPFQFVETPAMRWTNPVNAARDGTVFLWTRSGRPQAILQLYTYDDEHFSHEWQSLSDGTIIAERDAEAVWKPAGAGLHFTNLKEIELPAATPAARLRQMKALAERFSSTFLPYVASESDPPVELRLLRQPLLRYESPDFDVIDGSLFAFVQGTDPQSLLIVEAFGTDQSKAAWRFAFARLASGAVAAKLDDRQVFSVSKYDFRRDPGQPCLLLPKQPAPAP
jgi:hypothetical protein